MTVSTILRLLPTDPRWTSFLESRTESGIFHHPVWSQLMSDCYGYRPFVAALPGPNGNLTAGVPIMEVNNPFAGKRWVSLPFSDHCNPLSTNVSALQELADGIILLAEREKVQSLDLRGVYPELSAFHACSRHVIHEIDLRREEEKIWKCMHEMHRRNIKIARENDVRVIQGETIEHLENFYQMHLATRRRQGVPVQPLKFFMYIKKLLLDQEHGFLLLAQRDGQYIAGAIYLHFNKILTYKYGASRDDNLKYRPNNLVMWNAIQWGCSHGFARLDLGRTDLENTGLRTYKSRWGAREKPLYYSILSSRPLEPSSDRLEHLLHSVIQHSPLWVCRLTGELFYRYVG